MNRRPGSSRPKPDRYPIWPEARIAYRTSRSWLGRSSMSEGSRRLSVSHAMSSSFRIVAEASRMRRPQAPLRGARPLEGTVTPRGPCPSTVRYRPRELAPLKPHRVAVSAFSQETPQPPDASCTGGAGPPALDFPTNAARPTLLRHLPHSRAWIGSSRIQPPGRSNQGPNPLQPILAAIWSVAVTAESPPRPGRADVTSLVTLHLQDRIPALRHVRH